MSSLLIDHRTVRDFGTSDARLTEQGWSMARDFGTHRDADTVTASNHRVMLATLAKLDPDETGHGTMHCGHWAVGWYDHVLVDPKRADLVAALQAAADAVALYPLLDEDDHSDLENELHSEDACDGHCTFCEYEREDARDAKVRK